MKHIKTTKAAVTIMVIVGAALMLFSGYKKSGFDTQLDKTNITYQIATPKQTNEYELALERVNLTKKMDHYGVPGISLAIIKKGKLDWAKGYGLLQKGKAVKINTETMFSVGSVSKVGAAVATLRMVDKKLVDLDANVNNYLKSWKVTENSYTKNNPVTLRKIMSHTAGLTVHGFADYLPDETLPNTVQILNGQHPAKSGRVYVNIPVGSRFRYSGGGTTIEQLLIEDVTKLPFHKAAQNLVFTPLKMTRSSYENPLPKDFGNIAKAHNRYGKAVALPRGYQAMPEAAASGLWTTPTDFSKLMIALMDSYDRSNEAFLPNQLVNDMMTEVKPSNYGLGPRIERNDGVISFSHGGANDSYRAHFTGYLNNKNGLILFTNGTRGSELINELRPILTKILNNQ